MEGDNMPKLIDTYTEIPIIWANRSSITQDGQFQKNVFRGEICIVKQIIEGYTKGLQVHIARRRS